MNEPIVQLRRQQLLRWWGALLLATTLLSVLVSARYFAVTSFDSSLGALLFRSVMLVGHFMLLCSLLLSPVLLTGWLWPRPRWVVAIGSVWSAAVLIALLVDTQVFQLYRFHINAGVVNLLFGGAADETFIFPDVMYVQALLISAAIIVIMGGLAAALWFRVQRTAPRPGVRRAIVAASLLCIASFHAAHIWADVLAHEPVLEQTSVLPLRYAATAKRFLRAHGVPVRENLGVAMNDNSDRSGLSYPLIPLDCRPPANPPNILFILTDSWRFDEMNARVTPRTAAFAQRALRFLDHHSGGNATRIGVFSLFYSIPGTYWHPILNERRGPVFIDELLRQEYDVRVFRSAPLYSPEFDQTVFVNVPSLRLRSDGDGPAAWDKDLTADFFQFLDDRQDATPFFALLFYDSPHSYQFPGDYPLPFQPSAEHVNYFSLHSDTDETPLLNRYRNSLHYVDTLIGKVLDQVEARGLLENTVIVITGDHGQEFNDSGGNYWGHGSNFTRYQTGVPLVLYVPGREAGDVRHRTTHFDVAPTLMREHLGCDAAPSTFSVGRPLLEPGGRDPLVLSEYTDFAIVQRDRIAVVRKHGMQVFGPDYTKLDVSIDPAATRAALEQKTRFYRSVGRAISATTEPELPTVAH